MLTGYIQAHSLRITNIRRYHSKYLDLRDIFGKFIEWEENLS